MRRPSRVLAQSEHYAVDERQGTRSIVSPDQANDESPPLTLVALPALSNRLSASVQRQSLALDKAFPFSWPRCLLFFISYGLLLSDIFRAGAGIKAFDRSYVRVEPDAFVHFGPFAYPVQSLRANETDAQQRGQWIYKYDSTSVAMRAYADLLNVTSYPDCMRYKTTCQNDTIGFQTVFTMLDELTSAVAASTPRKHATDPVSISTRVQYLWIDRFHHLIVPEYFYGPLYRTNRALYYTPTALDYYTHRGFCVSKRFRPYSCEDVWVHFDQTPVYLDSGAVVANGSVWSDTQTRVQAFKTKYSGYQIDMLLLDSTDDPTKGGNTFRGRRAFDIVTILRARQCDETGNCTTVVVDDYRYESTMETSDVFDWYTIVATLRIIGQVYMWLRLLMLMVGCYAARMNDAAFLSASLRERTYATWTTILMVPSQVVIYSSTFPIACYLLAHLIDAPMQSEVISERYRTALGLIQINFSDFVQLSSVLMRNVWIFASVLHILVVLRTRRHWTFVNGVVGIGEFCISLTAALTTVAHYRSVAFRDSRVVHVQEIVDSYAFSAVRTFRYYDTTIFVRGLFFSLILDGKMLLTALLLVTSMVFFIGFVLRYVCKFRIQTTLWSRSSVSYATNQLWPANALIVGWNGGVFVQESHHLAREQTQRRLVSLEYRRPEDQALVFLMNLCMMTDPITFVRLRWMKSTRLVIWRSKKTKKVVLLPETGDLVRISDLELHDWEQLEVVEAASVPWTKLLLCG